MSSRWMRPTQRNEKELSARTNALKIPSQIFCGPSFLLLCMETHDMMDLAAVKETGKSEVIKEKHYGIIW